VEIQCSLDGEVPDALNYLEHLFLSIFLADLILRVVARETGYWLSGWFFLESSLVVVGVLSQWIITPILNATGGQSSARVLRQSFLLRIPRLLRLVRAVRLVEVFGQLAKLCNGFVNSARTVVYALVLVLFVTYVFACVAVEVITQSEALRKDEATRFIVETRFGSLLRSGLTLISFANADSLSSLYEPLIEQDAWLTVFFGLVWLVITVSLMNLVTAVIVDNAISQSREDLETQNAELRKRVRVLQPEIDALFDDLDQSKDGTLEIEELDLSMVRVPDDLRSIIQDEDRLKDLFQYLDDDGSGTVDKREFTSGIMNLALQNVPIETTQTLQLLRSHSTALADIQDALLGLIKDVRACQGTSPMVPSRGVSHVVTARGPVA
jgi:voltage-gated sodium channel